MRGIPKLRLLSICIPHALHGCLLILPTIAIQQFADWEFVLWVFFGVVIFAGVAESFCQSRGQRQPALLNRSTDLPMIEDAKAIRVASIVGVLLLLIFWLSQIESYFFSIHWPAFQSVGFLAIIVGVAMRSAAILALGPAFVSDIRCQGELVQDGIYRWLRHPSEVGLILIGVGAPMLLCSLVTVGFSVFALLPISIWRVRRENELLKQFEFRHNSSNSLDFRENIPTPSKAF